MQVIEETQKIENKTVGEIVVEDFRTAEVFKNFGIDFCCGGKHTVKEVCEKHNINFEEVKDALSKVAQRVNAGNGKNFSDWSPDFLIEYIINIHHKYVRENIPALLEYTQKIARVHGQHYPELIEIAQIFRDISIELPSHMMKEEKILFPYIKHLVEVEQTGQSWIEPAFESAENPIHMMELEHESAGENMRKIRALSNNFSLPEEACNTYRITFFKLDEFEEDLHQHIHLENNILFPRAIQLEKKLNENRAES